MKKSLLLYVFCIMQYGLDAQGDSLRINSDSLVLHTDTTVVKTPKTLLDSLSYPELLRSFFYLNEKVTGQLVELQTREQSRDLPRLKAIRIRKTNFDTWKVWILLLTVALLTLIRLTNIKRFNEVMQFSFDMHADLKSYREKIGNYLLILSGLFLNFALSLSLFFTNFLEVTYQVVDEDPSLFFWKLSGFIVLIYLAKFLIQVLIGYIFKMRTVVFVTLHNSISVNILAGVILVLMNLFFVLVKDPLIASRIAAFILVILLVALIYRQVKNLVMVRSAGQFHFIYLFLYLCALEFAPLLVLFRLFLNNW